MKPVQKGIARRWVWLVTVAAALGCEARATLDPVVTGGAPREGADASAAGGGEDAGTDAGPPVPTAVLVQEVMRRWNLVVDDGSWTIDFHWRQVNQFPHPTFKFGTAEAYGQFASVLLAFFERDDDFDFLARNHLFEIELRADTLSGQGGVVTSFEALADYFSSSTAFGDIAPDVRDRLAQLAQRIHQLG